jgi:hypothetical protein
LLPKRPRKNAPLVKKKNGANGNIGTTIVAIALRNATEPAKDTGTAIRKRRETTAVAAMGTKIGVVITDPEMTTRTRTNTATNAHGTPVTTQRKNPGIGIGTGTDQESDQKTEMTKGGRGGGRKISKISSSQTPRRIFPSPTKKRPRTTLRPFFETRG